MKNFVFADECEEVLFFMENTPESRRQLRQPIIKVLNNIFQLGYVRARGEEEYGRYGGSVNCFEHACFNLTNDLIDGLGLNDLKYCFASPFGGFDTTSVQSAKEEILDFVRQTGLEMKEEKFPKALKANQYRVALYFSEGFAKAFRTKDFHLLVQEFDGSWSGKRGSQSDIVDHYSKLEESLPFDHSNRYVLDSVYVVTNPYASAEKQK